YPADPDDARTRAFLDSGRRAGGSDAKVDPPSQALPRPERAQALRKAEGDRCLKRGAFLPVIGTSAALKSRAFSFPAAIWQCPVTIFVERAVAAAVQTDSFDRSILLVSPHFATSETVTHFSWKCSKR